MRVIRLRDSKGKVTNEYDYDVSAEVKRGAAALDKIRPGWHNAITRGTLDLSRSRMCVLGQLAVDRVFQDAVGARNISGYEQARYAMSGDGRTARAVAAHPVKYGFNIEDADDERRRAALDDERISSSGLRREQIAYEALTVEWGRIIRQRREADRRLEGAK